MELLKEMPQELMVKWRRHIHENPELSFQEFETAKYIEGVLRTFSNLEIEKLTENSVIAYLRGDQKGPTIALRADIDALPITELADVTFKSKNDGVMHACGHDSHTTMLLGAASYLSNLKSEIKGTVKFIFQHAEETPPGGAVELIEKGVLEDVDQIFGLHVFPGVPVGVALAGSGYVMAASDVVTLQIKGVGGHGSTPHLTVDPVVIGAEIITNLNNIVARNIDPFANVVISFGEFCAGHTSNIIPDTAKLSLSVRTNNPDVRLYVKDRIETIIKHTCEMYNAQYELDYLMGYMPLKNDVEATNVVKKSLTQIFGEQGVLEFSPVMGSEDFSAYSNVKPASFFIIGAGAAEEGYGFSVHHPKFKIDESVLSYGAASHVQIIKDLLMS